MRKKFYFFSFIAIIVSTSYVPTLLALDSDHTVGDEADRYDLKLTTKLPIEYMPREVLVKFKPEATMYSIEGLHSAIGAVEMERILPSGIKHIKFLSDISVEEAVVQYEMNPDVEYAEPNYIIQFYGMPDDSNFDQLWGMNNTGQEIDGILGTEDADIDAPEAWDITTGSQNVIIAVIDSGVAHLHPELISNRWINASEWLGQTGVDDDGNGYIDDKYGWDFWANDSDPTDYLGHGTHVAGTIAAQGDNETAIAGVNWNASIMVLRSSGLIGGSVAAADEAIRYAVDNGAVIINASWGIDKFSQVLYDAIEYADSRGVLFIAAAGNDNIDNDVIPHYPASYDLQNIIAVAASDQDDELVNLSDNSGSNYGVISVDVAAPGKNIYSTIPVRGLDTEVIVYTEDFDPFPTGWTFGGTNNSWALVADTGIDGTGCLEDSPAENYSYNTMSFSGRTIPINSVKDNIYKLSFNVNYELEFDHDRLYTAGSIDGQNFIKTDDYETGSTNDMFVPRDSEAYTLFADVYSQFYIGFLLETNDINNLDGVYIDDLELSRRPIIIEGYDYKYTGGTSMAAPHVAGIAGLVKSQNPNFTHLQIRDAILNGVDPKGSLFGKVATGGRVNAYKALCLLSPPKNVIATIENSGSTVTLSWDPNTKDNGLTGYIISYTTSSGYTDQIQLENITSWTIMGLQNGITYNFAVRAFAYFQSVGVIEGPNSVIVTVTPGNVCPGDFDGDDDVDGSDLSVFAADFGRTNCDTGLVCEGDFDKDNDVDGSDLAVFAADFGKTNCR